MRQFNVTGMSCAACSARVEKAVSAVPGVEYRLIYGTTASSFLRWLTGDLFFSRAIEVKSTTSDVNITSLSYALSQGSVTRDDGMTISGNTATRVIRLDPAFSGTVTFTGSGRFTS